VVIAVIRHNETIRCYCIQDYLWVNLLLLEEPAKDVEGRLEPGTPRVGHRQQEEECSFNAATQMRYHGNADHNQHGLTGAGERPIQDLIRFKMK